MCVLDEDEVAQKKKTAGPIQKKPKTSASSHSAAVPEGPAPPDAHVVHVVHVTPEGRFYIKIGEDYFAADSMSSTIPGPKLGTLETGAAKH